MKIHPIRIDFNVTPEIGRYVYVYIIEAQHLYMIDCGVAGSERQINDFLKSIGRKETDIKSIFLTHAHPDHIGTAAYFKKAVGCEIYASMGEQPWIENIDLQYAERPIPFFYALAGESVCVDHIVKDGDTLLLEKDLKLRVISTAGHSVDGYGKMLLQLAITYATDILHAKKITLGVFRENLPALECYKSVGFEITANDSYMIDGEEWEGYEMERI